MNATFEEKSSKSLSLAATELALRAKLLTAGTKAEDNLEVANRIMEENNSLAIFDE